MQGGLPLKPNNVTALSVSSTFFNYAPCLVSDDMIGAAATAVGINIVPEVGCDCQRSLGLETVPLNPMHAKS